MPANQSSEIVETFGAPRNAEADAQLTADMAAIKEAERIPGSCWCWQYGRCLGPDRCVTWTEPRPMPFTNTEWKRAYMALRYGTQEVTNVG